MVGILDYGVGNIASVYNIFRHLSIPACVSRQLSELDQATHLVLPGVGHFAHGWELLEKGGFVSFLREKVEAQHTPLLGICLGAHYLGSWSEEGQCPGFAWIQAKTRRFDPQQMSSTLPIPHMGWNTVHPTKPHPLTQDLPEPSRFYFLHSYHFVDVPPSQSLLTADYGYPFVCGVADKNVMGVQFHPEKSHRFGMKLLRNFSQIGLAP